MLSVLLFICGFLLIPVNPVSPLWLDCVPIVIPVYICVNSVYFVF